MVLEILMISEESSGLQVKVAKWLENTGYPLEMLVYNKFYNGSNFKIRHGWYFKDPETDISREIDIVATIHEPLGLAEINFVIECKKTSKPWVLFTSEDAHSGFHRLNSFALISEHARNSLVDVLCDETEKTEEIPWLWKNGRVGHGLIQALSSTSDVAYKATLSAVKASIWLQNNSFWQSTELRQFVLSFPVIVISSPLYESYIDEKGETKLQEINYGFLFFNQQIKNFNGTCVMVVNEKHLDQFVKDCNSIESKVFEILEPSIKEKWDAFIKKNKKT